MRIVYKTHTDYSAKEFGLMNMVLQKKNPKVRKVEYILAAVFALVIIAFLYNKWFVAAGVCAVMAVAVFVFLIPFNLRRVAEKQFDKSRLEGMRSNLTFYMDHYEEVNKLGRVAYKYVQLREIIETDTNFYLMKTNMQGCIVVKANCAPNLIKFLSKIKAQYKL